jgi:hypothetical protein
MQVSAQYNCHSKKGANVEVAALCAETQDRQGGILEILRNVLNLSKFPSISILDDLVDVWGGANMV